jgi:hypothetical protein
LNFRATEILFLWRELNFRATEIVNFPNPSENGNNYPLLGAGLSRITLWASALQRRQVPKSENFCATEIPIVGNPRL